MQFLNGSRAIVLSGLLVAQCVAFYVTPTSEKAPAAKPLSGLSKDIGDWTTVSDTKPDKEIMDLLRADDTLTRVYQNPQGRTASLFVAFFKSQRAGVSPHSPKVCLPGSGWLPEKSGHIELQIPSERRSITVNRYIVSRGEYRSLVLYWYQSPQRVVADEFAAKFWLVLDGIRYRRSDTSLVRVIVPVGPGGEEAAEQQAETFVQASFSQVKNQLPN